MKRALVTISIVMISAMIYSQSFPLKSSKWYYTNNGGTQPPNSTLKIVEYEKDTVISDIQSVKLTNGYVFYSHNDSVFYFNPDQSRFGLVYDYSAQVGDTIELITPAGTTSDKLTFKIKIDSITKRIYSNDTVIHYCHTSLDSDFHFENNVYMTRIGAYNILPDWGNSIPEGDYLKCYEDSSVYINYSNIPCDSVVTGLANLYNDKIEIYPNPAHNELIIDSELMENSIFEIYDGLGRLMLRDKMITKSETIDISHLGPGFYYVRIDVIDKISIVRTILIR